MKTHWNIQNWKSETSFYHFYFWKSKFAVGRLHDISQPRQFSFRSFGDGHLVQAIGMGPCEQVRLSIVLVISDFFVRESTLKSLHDSAVHDKVPGLDGVGGHVHVDVQTSVQVPHLGRWRKSMKKIKVDKITCHRYYWGGSNTKLCHWKGTLKELFRIHWCHSGGSGY